MPVKAPERLVDFSLGGSDLFTKAHGWSNGGVFGCTWTKENAVIDGALTLRVTREDSGFFGAEYRSNEKYGYGYYAVSMKPSSCSGVISSFFTYTGDPWDEIDIEFLGKDTSVVQFNYFTNGVGNHEYLCPLGFDAAEDFHEYGFLWEQDAITWFVDGKAVYQASENIPSHPGQIMMNVWNPVGVDGWAGKLNEAALPAHAVYQWIDYTEETSTP